MVEAGWPFLTPGLPDADFRRLPGVPMTREEVRVLVVAKLRLQSGQTVYDIGAGTGSLAVETGLLVRPGVVYAIEMDPAAAALVRENVCRWGADNVRVVEGVAPAALAGLPEADRIIIGGTRGRLSGVLTQGWSRLRPGGLAVITAVTLETLQAALETLQELGGYREALCVQTGRLEVLGSGHSFRELHQNYLIVGEKTHDS